MQFHTRAHRWGGLIYRYAMHTYIFTYLRTTTTNKLHTMLEYISHNKNRNYGRHTKKQQPATF